MTHLPRAVAVSCWLALAGCAAPAPAAHVYEDFYVPAVFGPWAERAVSLAALQPGERVLAVDEAALQRLLAAAETRLAGFENADGSVAVPLRAHAVTGRKPAARGS